MRNWSSTNIVAVLRRDFKDFQNFQCLMCVVTVCSHVLGLQNWKAESLIPNAAHSGHQPPCKSLGPAPPLDHVSPGGVLQTGTLSPAAHQGWHWVSLWQGPWRTLIIFFGERGFSRLFYFSSCNSWILSKFRFSGHCEWSAFCLRHFCFEEKSFLVEVCCLSIIWKGLSLFVFYWVTKKVIKAIFVSPCGTKLIIFDSCLLLLGRLFPLMDEPWHNVSKLYGKLESRNH